MRRLWMVLAVALACQLLPCALARAAAPSLTAPLDVQAAPEAEVEVVEPPHDPEAGRAETATLLETARRRLTAAQEAAAPGVDPPAALVRDIELLEQLDSLFALQQAAQRRLEELTNAKTDLEGKLAVGDQAAVDGEVIDSFLTLDRARDVLAGEESRAENLEAALETAREAVARAKQLAEEKEQARRKAKEALDANKEVAEEAPLVAALAAAELESRVAREAARLREMEFDNEKLVQDAQQLRVAMLSARLKQAETTITFSPSDLETQLTELDRQQAQLERTLEAARLNFEYRNRLWQEARDDAGPAVAANSAEGEEVEARRLARQAVQEEIAVLNRRTKHLPEQRAAWRRRFDAATTEVPNADLTTWEAETREALDDLRREEGLQTIRLGELRRDLAGLETRLAAPDLPNGEAAPWREAQRTSLQEQIALFESDLAAIAANIQLHEKLLSEIRGRRGSASIGDWFVGIGDRVSHIWDYEIVAVDERPITIGKILLAVVLMIMGFLCSSLISRAFARRVLPRVGMNASATAALQTVAFYTLVAIFSLLALHVVNVPLTVFTFLGGAVAIGVGFGSQNIINNFISGLILLAERPVRVGDLIQLDTLYGTVERIGARSTRIRTGTNMEIIVPNSSFLQNNVINWTLSDNRIRTSVIVGVNYGSPTRDVARLLKRAATEHGLVQENPEPFVLFTDFGDNALIFEVHFWINMRTINERRRIESDIRFMIDQYFRDAGIGIAFPQRDVHLDASGVLQVRMTGPNDQEAVDQERGD